MSVNGCKSEEMRNNNTLLCKCFLAKLLRAKRASGAPWVRIFGKPMRPRKFGAYARPSRLQTLGGGGVES